MKDACHHLKHLQRKVLQAVKKAEAAESSNSPLVLNNFKNHKEDYSTLEHKK